MKFCFALASLVAIADWVGFLRLPALASPPADVSVCYMQTADHRLLNLDRLCQQPPGTVAIRRLTYHRNLISGQIENRSGQVAYGVQVHYQVVGQSGNVIEQNAVEVNPPTLQPGQTATFETVVPGRSRLHNPYLTWRDRL